VQALGAVAQRRLEHIKEGLDQALTLLTQQQQELRELPGIPRRIAVSLRQHVYELRASVPRINKPLDQARGAVEEIVTMLPADERIIRNQVGDVLGRLTTVEQDLRPLHTVVARLYEQADALSQARRGERGAVDWRRVGKTAGTAVAFMVGFALVLALFEQSYSELTRLLETTLSSEVIHWLRIVRRALVVFGALLGLTGGILFGVETWRQTDPRARMTGTEPSGPKSVQEHPGRIDVRARLKKARQDAPKNYLEWAVPRYLRRKEGQLQRWRQLRNEIEGIRLFAHRVERAPKVLRWPLSWMGQIYLSFWGLVYKQLALRQWRLWIRQFRLVHMLTELKSGTDLTAHQEFVARMKQDLRADNRLSSRQQGVRDAMDEVRALLNRLRKGESGAAADADEWRISHPLRTKSEVFRYLDAVRPWRIRLKENGPTITIRWGINPPRGSEMEFTPDGSMVRRVALRGSFGGLYRQLFSLETWTEWRALLRYLGLPDPSTLVSSLGFSRDLRTIAIAVPDALWDADDYDGLLEGRLQEYLVWRGPAWRIMPESKLVGHRRPESTRRPQEEPSVIQTGERLRGPLDWPRAREAQAFLDGLVQLLREEVRQVPIPGDVRKYLSSRDVGVQFVPRGSPELHGQLVHIAYRLRDRTGSLGGPLTFYVEENTTDLTLVHWSSVADDVAPDSWVEGIGTQTNNAAAPHFHHAATSFDHSASH
jgi:hypothetical protein